MVEIPVERLPARRRGRGPHPTGGAALRAFVLGERERISRRSRVRELVLGFQDGLLVPLAVVTGLAGADVASETVLVGGLAEAAAGAVAMGSGAYLASQAENQLFRNEIEDEEHELTNHPEVDRRLHPGVVLRVEKRRIGMRPTEPFRREHAELHAHIEHIGQAAREIPRLDRGERELLVGRIVDFLTGTLLPHAKAEEEVLYPEWAKLVGSPDAAAPMVHDHQAIVERVERLERADPDDVDTLQELLYGLHALISVHFRKEEDIQLPAFDAAPPELTQAVLERMEALAGHDHAHSH